MEHTTSVLVMSGGASINFASERISYSYQGTKGCVIQRILHYNVKYALSLLQEHYLQDEGGGRDTPKMPNTYSVVEFGATRSLGSHASLQVLCLYRTPAKKSERWRFPLQVWMSLEQPQGYSRLVCVLQLDGGQQRTRCTQHGFGARQPHKFRNKYIYIYTKYTKYEYMFFVERHGDRPYWDPYI